MTALELVCFGPTFILVQRNICEASGARHRLAKIPGGLTEINQIDGCVDGRVLNARVSSPYVPDHPATCFRRPPGSRTMGFVRRKCDGSKRPGASTSGEQKVPAIFFRKFAYKAVDSFGCVAVYSATTRAAAPLAIEEFALETGGSLVVGRKG